MIYFTADSHFGHANILRYCHRPFSTIDEMDETIIANWNFIVNSGDTVYHLGDFAFRNPLQYRKRLKGNIVLIRGNHDFKRIKGKCNIDLFESIHDLLEIRINDQPIVLCHYAMRVWSKSHFNSWQLYGHSHNTLDEYGKTYDVGVDGNNFTPVSISQLYKIMEKKPDNVNLLKRLKGYDEKEFQETKKLVESGEDIE